MRDGREAGVGAARGGRGQCERAVSKTGVGLADRPNFSKALAGKEARKLADVAVFAANRYMLCKAGCPSGRGQTSSSRPRRAHCFQQRCRDNVQGGAFRPAPDDRAVSSPTPRPPHARCAMFGSMTTGWGAGPGTAPLIHPPPSSAPAARIEVAAGRGRRPRRWRSCLVLH